MSVSELAEATGMDGTTAVHHLSTLEEAGLVSHYKRGNRKYDELVRRVELRIAPPPERTFVLQATEIDEPDTTADDCSPPVGVARRTRALADPLPNRRRVYSYPTTVPPRADSYM
ncbi:transcriptional regulator [Natrinema mahii]|nr:transcriptional regulator [Natrinema mahii]